MSFISYYKEAILHTYSVSFDFPSTILNCVIASSTFPRKQIGRKLTFPLKRKHLFDFYFHTLYKNNLLDIFGHFELKD
jgi:hypothetical protein